MSDSKRHEEKKAAEKKQEENFAFLAALTKAELDELYLKLGFERAKEQKELLLDVEKSKQQLAKSEKEFAQAMRTIQEFDAKSAADRIKELETKQEKKPDEIKVLAELKIQAAIQTTVNQIQTLQTQIAASAPQMLTQSANKWLVTHFAGVTANSPINTTPVMLPGDSAPKTFAERIVDRLADVGARVAGMSPGTSPRDALFTQINVAGGAIDIFNDFKAVNLKLPAEQREKVPAGMIAAVIDFANNHGLAYLQEVMKMKGSMSQLFHHLKDLNNQKAALDRGEPVQVQTEGKGETMIPASVPYETKKRTLVAKQAFISPVLRGACMEFSKMEKITLTATGKVTLFHLTVQGKKMHFPIIK